MNREQKLSLIIGFTLILLVGVLISDHLSGARTASVSGVEGEEVGLFETQLTSGDTDVGEFAPFSSPGHVEPKPLASRLVEDAPPGPGVTELPSALAGAPAASEPPTVPESPVSSEPFAIIDQSNTGGTNSDLFSEIARRGGKLLEQGSETLLQLPTVALAKTDKAAKPESKPQPLRRHTVGQGESLWGIAEKYYSDGRQWKRIADHNAPLIGQGGVVRAGVQLEIPGLTTPDAPRETSSPAKAAPPRQSSTEKARTYTVRKHDTIGEIAQNLLGSAKRWTEIASLNKIEDENMLYEGQVIEIPAK